MNVFISLTSYGQPTVNYFSQSSRSIANEYTNEHDRRNVFLINK